MPNNQEDHMPSEQSQSSGVTWFDSADQYSFIDQKIVAMSLRVAINGAPRWYERTYALAIALGPLACGIVGLFGYDADFWVWSKSKGFRPFNLHKRNSKTGAS